MSRYLQTYKLTNDVGQTSKGKYQIIRFSTKVDNVQRDKNTATKSNLKACSNAKLQPAQVKGLTKQRGITICPQSRENALKGSADYSAPIQKALWLKTRTQHLLCKYFTRTT